MPDEKEPRYVYKVRNWNTLHETNKSRRVGELEWYKDRFQIGTEEFSELMGMEDGIAFYGIYKVMLQMALRGHPRGTLLRFDGTPHTPESISRAVHLPTPMCARAVHALTLVGWIERSSFSIQSLTPDIAVTLSRPRTDPEVTPPRVSSDPSRRARGVELSREQQQQQQQINKQQQHARENDFPLTVAAVRKRDPGVNGDFCSKLISACQQRVEREGISEPVPDRVIAKAIEKSFQAKSKNHGTGLLLQRVPEILTTWAKERQEK
jgi:hypothetical protein